MARSLNYPVPHLVDLDVPLLDFSRDEAPEALLRRLRTQNSALDQLRDALAIEERSHINEMRAGA